MTKDLNTIIDKMAHLARIEITQEERALFATSLSSIIDYFDLLLSLNTQQAQADPVDVKPMPFREDIPDSPLSKKAFLEGAPAAVGDLIRVPPVFKSS